MHVKFIIPLYLTLCVALHSVHGQSEIKLTASDSAAEDRFGFSVSVSGDRALIGAHLDDDSGINSGSAYVFRREGETWIEEAKLNPSDGVMGDAFGTAVSVSNDYVLVGASGDDDNGTDSGSAYVFRREGETWIEEAKLTPSDGAPGDIFGLAVSISGDRALIGAQFDDDSGINSGSAYVFRREGETWIEEAKLTPSDGAPGDFFGSSVSVSGDYALVGAYWGDASGTDSGSACVFRREGETWIEEAKLTPSDGAPGDFFGSSVSVSGDYALVGASGNEASGIDSGSAYVFRREGETWIEEAKLAPSDGAELDGFGSSVSVSSDHALVGAYWNDDNGTDSGSAYVFRREGEMWIEEAKLTPSDGAQDDLFGNSVSVSSDHVLVGAFFDDDNGTNSGSAYGYDLNEILGVSVEEEDSPLTATFVLHQNYPNPFNSLTIIPYSLQQIGYVNLDIFDIHGSKIQTLINRLQGPGNYELTFDASGLPSGVYMYHLSIDNFVERKMLILLK